MVSGVPTEDERAEQLSTDGEVSLRAVDPRGDDSSSTSNSSVLTLPGRSRFAHRLRLLAVPLALGQFLSVLIATTGIASKYLVNYGFSLPLAQNLIHYFLLALIYGIFSWSKLLSHHTETSLTRTQKLWDFLRIRGWQYFIAGTIDMHANWAIVSAYEYTNITSVQLLDCLTVPTAMILSRLCLKTRYKWIHVVGVIVCLGGAGAMVGADYLAAKMSNDNASAFIGEGSSQTSLVLFGDFLVFAGAVGYGASNVYQECLVRKYGIIDYLGFSTLSATLWTAIYCASLEHEKISELIRLSEKLNSAVILGSLAGFAAAMFILYTVLPFALSRTNSVLVNLSLLTADLYALLVGIYLFGNIFHPLYLFSFGAIIVGLCLFASRDPIFLETSETPKDESGA